MFSRVTRAKLYWNLKYILKRVEIIEPKALQMLTVYFKFKFFSEEI